MNVYQTVLDLIVNRLFEGIIILLLYTYVVGKSSFIRQNRLQSFMFVVTYTVFSQWIDMFMVRGINTLFYVVFCILILSFITKTSFFSSVIAIAIIDIFFVIIELFIVVLSILILRKDYNSLFNIVSYSVFGGIIVRGIEFFILFLVYNAKKSLFNFRLFKKENYIVSTGLIQMFIFCVLVPIFLAGIYIENKNLIFQILTLLLWILTTIFGVIDFIEREKITKANYQFKLQEANIENMKEIIGILRKSHHDIANHLNTIAAIARMNEGNTNQKVEEYVSNITNDLKQSYKSYNTGNEYINGLLAVKYTHAFDMGIRLEVDFEAKLSLIDVGDQALISIVSNIIDNAIQALENQHDGTDRFISVSGYMEGEKYTLSICNNGPVIPEKSLGKIFESGYSTKDKKNKDHGFGLYIVKKYVTRYSGEISVSSSEGETEFLIRFPVCKKVDVI